MSEEHHSGGGDDADTRRRRSTIVSFSKDKDEISIDGDQEDEEDDDDEETENFQMALGPYIQTYLAHSGESIACCGLQLPVPFERASTKSWWWDLRFDSEILERQYRKSSFSQLRHRFRFALAFMIILSLLWSGYLLILASLDKSLSVAALPLGLVYLFFAVGCSLVFLLTRIRSQAKLYRRYSLHLSFVVSLAVCCLSLTTLWMSSDKPVVSSASDFAVCVAILLIVYTVVPLPLYVCVLVCSLYSVIFEFLADSYWPAKKFLHASVHLIGLQIFIMTSVRMRGTFMKVGQSLLVRKQFEMEKQLKEKMIHSVMPMDVAVWLLEEEKRLKEEEKRLRAGEIDPLFRPFQMDCMKDVSILFADIVGFTRMSSKKTASELVAILNELFGRFDELCAHNSCEKISTLGDCYYCVSGCPTPRSDHAQCCVEMGLGMIKAIAEFDHEKHEDINMRVGVHTGSVLCGIVGRRRFKFDVWSNDVTLANKMESTGRPGRVHISEATRRFLGDSYILEKAGEHHGLDTYLIVCRKESIDDSTQATITSLSTDSRTAPILTASSVPSYETAVSRAEDSTDRIANSDERSTRTSSHFNCTTSPFNTITTDSRLNSDQLTPHTPSLNVAIPSRHLLDVSADSLTDDGKATSLPNMSMHNGQADDGRSVMGSGPLLISARKPPPSWKYSRLKLNCSDMENGKVQKTYKVSSSGEPSPIEKTINNQLEVPKDDLSYSHSVNSRKDSGIRSNSRRSSIQQQLFSLSGVSPNDFHRVSGYYTSSQSSLNGSYQGKCKSRIPTPLTDLGACFQKIRKQSDLQLIRCVQDNSRSDKSYFELPPLKSWSLLFKYPDMEVEYRERAHRETSGTNRSRTLATSRFNTYFDITISFIVFTSISLSLLFTYSSSLSWRIVFLLLLAIQLLVIVTCLYSMVRPLVSKLTRPCLSWYPWHVIGGTLVSLPLLAALSHVELASSSNESLHVYSCSVFVGLVHFCNFTQLNCWMKSSLATLGGLMYLLLTTSAVVANPQLWSVDNATFDEAIYNLTKASFGLSYAVKFLYDYPSESDYPSKPPLYPMDTEHPNFALSDAQIETLRRSYFFLAEIFLSVLLLVLLVWFLNREFEKSYRLSFHSNAVAAKDKAKVEEMKVQAEKLLYNIIPKHVAEHLKSNTRFRYSEDIKSVGIIFATVINFDEMYDESFMYGKECLRFLNELVSDFDDLLDREQFSMVEKIKTIGATFMAASGLDPASRLKDSHEHLFQLMEFAFALQGAIENFNAHMLSFRFILRVGYNFGDVTAGVIGTNKLHYDIWGDAVNIASRMDTTGVANQIQVPVNCVPILGQRYNLERRGTVFVKGKDNMDVYLVKDRIPKKDEKIDAIPPDDRQAT